MIIPCKTCQSRLFAIYVGGIKERVEGKLWCKKCEVAQEVTVAVTYS